ncbi:STAS/SEC14 domain-containing protein [Pseudooceanicola nanhaiensis]|uniref:STAS/SEC14 domain-containing protein n=1 Tax=Pseudooceanicola nanhaiensis TaxID=375761 RepID=UPI003009CCF3
MLTLDTSDTPLLRITAGGEVTREEVRRFYEEFEAALDIAGRAGLLVDLSGFEDIEPRAMLEDMVKEFGLLDDLARMPRCAVVTGNRTIAGMIRYTAPLIPRMDMQAFPPEEGAAAEAWARDLPPPRPGRKDLPGLTMLDSGSPDVLAFEVEGYIDDDHIDRITAPFRARLEQGGRFNALARIKRFGGFDPEILFDKSLLGMKWDAVHALHRYAVVTDSGWVGPFAGIARMVSDVEVKVFPTSAEETAWAWVKEPIPKEAPSTAM